MFFNRKKNISELKNKHSFLIKVNLFFYLCIIMLSLTIMIIPVYKYLCSSNYSPTGFLFFFKEIFYFFNIDFAIRLETSYSLLLKDYFLKYNFTFDFDHIKNYFFDYNLIITLYWIFYYIFFFISINDNMEIEYIHFFFRIYFYYIKNHILFELVDFIEFINILLTNKLYIYIFLFDEFFFCDLLVTLDWYLNYYIYDLDWSEQIEKYLDASYYWESFYFSYKGFIQEFYKEFVIVIDRYLNYYIYDLDWSEQIEKYLDASYYWESFYFSYKGFIQEFYKEFVIVIDLYKEKDFLDVIVIICNYIIVLLRDVYELLLNEINVFIQEFYKEFVIDPYKEKDSLGVILIIYNYIVVLLRDVYELLLNEIYVFTQDLLIFYNLIEDNIDSIFIFFYNNKPLFLFFFFILDYFSLISFCFIYSIKDTLEYSIFIFDFEKLFFETIDEILDFFFYIKDFLLNLIKNKTVINNNINDNLVDINESFFLFKLKSQTKNDVLLFYYFEKRNYFKIIDNSSFILKIDSNNIFDFDQRYLVLISSDINKMNFFIYLNNFSINLDLFFIKNYLNNDFLNIKRSKFFFKIFSININDNILKIHDFNWVHLTFLAKVSDLSFLEFKSLQETIVFFPGETILSFFRLYNPTNINVSCISYYLIFPDEYTIYVNKLQCFCFDTILINSFESLELPVLFFVDLSISYDFVNTKIYIFYLILIKE